MGIKELLDDYGVPHVTGGKHSTAGWVQVECPFCEGNPGYHGGFNLEKAFYNCWRCGWHPLKQTLEMLTGENGGRLIREYGLLIFEPPDDKSAMTAKPRFLEMPGTLLSERHRKYLESRRFTPDEIIDRWHVLGTDHIGPYKFRIMAPIYFKRKLVSYQGRDITGKAEAKYKACAGENEIIHHKHVLYGYDKAIWTRVVVVEGVTDVWRLGPGAVATFGIEYTKEQLLLLARSFDSFLIAFDSDPQAQTQAHKLASELLGLGKFPVDLYPCKIGDPDDLPDYLVREVMGDIIYYHKREPSAADALEHARSIQYD